MQKLFLTALLVGLAQWSYPAAAETEEIPVELVDDVDLEDDDEYNSIDIEDGENLESADGVERSWWSTIFKQALKLVKNAVKLDELACDGPACNSCVNINLPKLHKKGCFNLIYQDAHLRLDLSLNDEPVWGINIDTGRPLPSCVKLPSPIKKACIQDFDVDVNSNGDGSMCFTLGFPDLLFGAKYCVRMHDKKLSVDKSPSFVKL